MKTANKFFTTIFILFSTSLVLVSCSPEDGKDGLDGEQGPIGNANVIVSAWETATNPQIEVIDASNVRTAIVNAPEITSNILENSAIFTYFRFSSNTFPLPYISYAGGKVNTISYTPQVGSIKIIRFTHDNSNSSSLPTQLEYKYVIIPKAANAQRLMSNENKQGKFILNETLYTLEELKAFSYEEICVLLNILE